MTKSPEHSWLGAARPLAIGFAVAVIYFVLGRIGLMFVAKHEGVATIWPPSGLLLGVLLVTPFRRWPFIVIPTFASIVVANYSGGNSLGLSLVFALTNCSESLVGAAAVLLILRRPPVLDRLRDALVVMGAAVVAANAATGMLAASLIGPLTGGSYWRVWRVWSVANGGGMLVVAPLVLTLARIRPGEWRWRRCVEATVEIGVLTVVSFWVFGAAPDEVRAFFRYPYILIPIVLLLAIRLGPAGAAVGNFIVAAGTLWGGSRGTGFFYLLGAGGTDSPVLDAQVFLAATAMTTVIAAALYQERRSAEESLRESKSLLNGILDGTHDAIYAKDRAGRYLLFNEGAARVTGRTADEVLGRDDTYIFKPDEADEIMRGDRGVMEAGEVMLYEETVTATDGARRTFLSSKGPLRDANGSVSGLFGIARDVTEQKRAEEELRNTLESIEDGFLAVDAEWRLIYVNAMAERVLGIDRGEVIGTPIWDAFPATVGTNLEREYRRAATGEKLDFENFYEPLGRRFHNVCYPRKGGGMSVFFRDITESKRAEEALRVSEATLNRSQEIAGIGDWTWDTSTNRVRWSAEMYRIFGIEPPADGADVDLFEVIQRAIHPDDRERVNASNDRVLSEGRPAELEYRVVRPDGSVRVVSAFPGGASRDANGAVLQLWGIVQDITERKRAEEESLRLRGQFLDAQKMEAIGTLASGIAHDFNNILTPILSHVELALMEAEDDSPVLADLTAIRVGTDRAITLVKQILDLSRHEGEVLAVVGLSPLVKEVAKFLRASLPSTIELRTSIDPHSGAVLGDLNRLHQVLLNLCTNARDAMLEKGGLLTIALQPMHGKRVMLSVSDTGHGIAPENVDRVFEPYFTTKPRGKGTGLGLATVRSIVNAMRGEVRVRSEFGRGTTFEVLLPEVEREVAPSASVRSFVRGRGQNLLVVDDEPPIATAMVSMAQALGYRATAFTVSSEALEALRADPMRYDAIFTDLTMPGMTGLSLAREAFKLRPELPVLLSTGYLEAIDEAAILSSGVKKILMKPYSVHDLGEALEEAFGAAEVAGRQQSAE